MKTCMFEIYFRCTELRFVQFKCMLILLQSEQSSTVVPWMFNNLPNDIVGKF